MKKVKNIKFIITLFCILFLSVVSFAQNVTDTITNDLLFKNAKEAAFRKNYSTARDICKRILLKDSMYVDAEVLIGRTFAWEKKYDDARRVFKSVLNKKYGYKDAILAIIDVETWSENYEAAVKYADIGLSFQPNDLELMLKKAKALAYSGGNYEGAKTIVQQVLLKEPENPEGLSLLAFIENAMIRNKVSFFYSLDMFKGFSPAHLGYVEFAHRFKTSTLIGRVNYADRYGYDGLQYELDFYHKINKFGYVYLNGGYSASSNLFPLMRFGVDIYPKLSKHFDLSVGLRYLDFTSKNIFIYTASLGKTFNKTQVLLRTFITFNDSLFGQSYLLQIRQYFKKKETNLTFLAGIGSSPDDNKLFQNNVEAYYLKSYKFQLRLQTRPSLHFMYSVGSGFQNEEYYHTKYRNRFTTEVILSYLF